MEKVISILEEIEKINSIYDISNDRTSKLRNEITNAKVCIPIIGKFSSGKSALVNTVLGYSRKILREDITPETAIPAELVYTDTEEQVIIVRNDGTSKTLSIDDYRRYEADATTIKSARIKLRNSFLEKISDVMLVDMPGFESGFEIHNKAIDDYLPQSLAYIITFPADDMIVRSSIGDILKELCLHDMPLCVVITKYDKKNDDFEIVFEKLQESMKRFVGDREIRYCRTSSFTGDAEELEEFLKEIQEKSQDILAGKYKKLAVAIVENTENYLKSILNNSQLSESELDEQEEKIQKQILSMSSKLLEVQNDFESEISEYVEEIKSDVQEAMEGAEFTLEMMILNNQSINDYLNSLVRNVVTTSIQKRLNPKIQKYLNKVERTIYDESIGDVHISFDIDIEEINKGITSGIVAMVAAALVSLPILGLITGFVAGLVMKFVGDKKREETKQAIRMKLKTEVFPQVLEQVATNVEKAIREQIKLVNTSIQDEFENQKDILEKAMVDVRKQMNEEKTRKENLVSGIKKDLEKIEGMKDDLR